MKPIMHSDAWRFDRRSGSAPLHAKEPIKTGMDRHRGFQVSFVLTRTLCSGVQHSNFTPNGF